MNILVAPDSFKGCLSAAEVSAAMAKGLKKGNSQINCAIRPVGDGGEGTVESLVKATGGRFSAYFDVSGPLEKTSESQVWNKRR